MASVVDDNSTNSTTGKCSNDGLIYFPLTYSVLYLTALSLSVFAACVRLANKKTKHTTVGRRIDSLVYYSHRFKHFARKAHSGDTWPSQLLITSVFLCNFVYICLAIVRAYHPQTRCFQSIGHHADLVTELLVSPLLCLFFVVRLLASDNVIRFWTKLHTIVDIVTLPNIYLFLYLGQDWLITKTFRVVWLTQLAVVLRFLPLRSSRGAIEALRVILRLIVLWLGAAGLIHMPETTGDPWKNFSNRQSYTYLEYVYFTIVTLSTVGYGDISAVTDTGRAFMVLFIIGGIAYFAFFLPSLVHSVVDRYQYNRWKKFYLSRVTRHVIVCGPLTAAVVADFLKQFLLHQDLEKEKTHVLLMHTEQPDQKLRVLLRCHYYRVQYLIGSVLNAADLDRAKLCECQEVFILTRKQCEYPEREDEENLLRLLSIKTAAQNVPVTIQVLLSSSKRKVRDIPHAEKDTVVCFSELRLGLLSRSCVCPGLTTLVCNLFHTTREVNEANKDQEWRELYSQGVLQKIYCSHFSAAFDELSFYAAAEKCYDVLGLVLIALKDTQQQKMYIAPSEGKYGCVIGSYERGAATLGYFIGRSQADVNRVSRFIERERSGDLVVALGRMSSISVPRAARFLLRRRSSTRDDMMIAQDRQVKDEGFQYTEPVSVEKCVASPHLRDHLIVCVIADEDSRPLNLKDFLEPIRPKSSVLDAELLPVVIVARKSYLEKEWAFVSRFPAVSVVVGNPLEWAVLTRASVQRCRTCVILTAASQKEAGTGEVFTCDKGAVLCSLMVRNNLDPPPPMAIVLENDFNAKFLDFEGGSESAHVHLTPPFARGEILASSFFDSITVSSFYCPGSILVAEQIIGGRTSKHCPTKSSIHIKPLSDLVSRHHDLRTFKDLYTALLRENKSAVALSRTFEPGDGERGQSQRYTVTAPPPDTVILPSDHVLFLCDSS